MKTLKKKPKIFGYVPIGNKEIKIGYIQLVDYSTEFSIPQIEFSLDEEFRGKGIMSKELPKYLKYCKGFGYTKLIANVKKDNQPSIKLLEKNGFIRLAVLKNVYSYVIDLNLAKEQLLSALKAMEKMGYNIIQNSDENIHTD